MSARRTNREVAFVRRLLSILMLSLLAVLAVLPVSAGAKTQNKVYVLHIDEQQEIDPGLAQLTERVFRDAEADPDAVAVAMIIDTPGGLVQSAFDMKETILRESRLKSVAFVQGGALSAGALVATAAGKLYMHPGSSIGAAEPRLQGSTQSADYKVVAAVASQFRAAAEARGRDANLAQAMVDVKARVDGQKDALLVMTAQEATSKRYADGLAGSLEEALQQAGITDPVRFDVQPTLSESAGRFLTTPWVAILLLVVGIICIGIEFVKPGLTIPGLIGITSLTLFFMGNVLVGTASWPELALALIGVLLLLIEAFIPGFGIFGIGGIAAMAASIFLSVRTPELAIRYLMWSSVALVLALFAIMRGISQRGLGKWLTLRHDEKGYVPARADYAELIGQNGKALTVLRPAGTAQFGTTKVDVVTEGDYVPAGTSVQVVRVEGTRVVVRPLGE